MIDTASGDRRDYTGMRESRGETFLVNRERATTTFRWICVEWLT
jgi:hypothetical protein